MPFDGSLQRSPVALSDLLDQLGIVPIPKEDLERHKRAELAKHPGSFLWRHRETVQLIQMVATMASGIAFLVTATAVAFTTYNNFALICGLAAFILLCPITAFVPMMFKNLAAATWVEHRVWSAERIFPAPVSELARRVRQAANKANITIRFTEGVLYQESVMLDPYLLVEAYDPHTDLNWTACLAIWDGDEVLALATST